MKAGAGGQGGGKPPPLRVTRHRRPRRAGGAPNII